MNQENQSFPAYCLTLITVLITQLTVEFVVNLDSIILALPVMVGIESSMVKVEESKPVSSCNVGVTTNGIILITYPHDQNHVECCSCVLIK